MLYLIDIDHSILRLNHCSNRNTVANLHDFHCSCSRRAVIIIYVSSRVITHFNFEIVAGLKWLVMQYKPCNIFSFGQFPGVLVLIA